MDQKKRTVNKRRRQSKSTSPLPIDVTSEILLRLPEKSVARFRCVSKLWLSTTTDPYFINLFETRSPRPSTLLCFKNDKNLYVCSIREHTHTLHPQDSNKSYSFSQPIDSYHIEFPGQENNQLPSSTESVHGLICFAQPENPIVWNPSKKEFLTLPKPRKLWIHLTTFLGYDPVEGKHKVMCMPTNRDSNVCRVLTLGSTKKTWRSVKTNHKHHAFAHNRGRCIQGVIYYIAYIHQTRDWVIMSFDVRSEKFNVIEFPSNIYREMLLTYQGKLAWVGLSGVDVVKNDRLFILEDPKKQLWSSQEIASFKFQHYDKRLETYFRSSCFTHAGELIFVPVKFSKSSYVLFYDPVRNSFRRFEFKEIGKGEQFVGGIHHSLHAFPNHIKTQISL